MLYTLNTVSKPKYQHPEVKYLGVGKNTDVEKSGSIMFYPVARICQYGKLPHGLNLGRVTVSNKIQTGTSNWLNEILMQISNITGYTVASQRSSRNVSSQWLILGFTLLKPI